MAGSATARSDDAEPTATTAAPAPQRARLNVRVGQAAVVTGSAAAGRTIVLERRTRGRWRALDRAYVDGSGRYRLRHVTTRASSARIRVRVTETAAAPGASSDA